MAWLDRLTIPVTAQDVVTEATAGHLAEQLAGAQDTIGAPGRRPARPDTRGSQSHVATLIANNTASGSSGLKSCPQGPSPAVLV
jgi:hypothetical protein